MERGHVFFWSGIFFFVECCNTHFPEAAVNFAEKLLYQCFIPSICVMHCLLLFCVTTVLSDYPQCGFSWWTLCYIVFCLSSSKSLLVWSVCHQTGLYKDSHICHPSKNQTKSHVWRWQYLFIFNILVTHNIFYHQISSFNHSVPVKYYRNDFGIILSVSSPETFVCQLAMVFMTHRHTHTHTHTHTHMSNITSNTALKLH